MNASEERHNGALVRAVEHFSALLEAEKKIRAAEARVHAATERRLLEMVQSLHEADKARTVAEAKITELERRLAAMDEPLARSA